MTADSDLREIEDIIKPSDSASDADGVAGSSLTTDQSNSDPRKAFLDQFTKDPEDLGKDDEEPKDDEEEDTKVESAEGKKPKDKPKTDPDLEDDDDLDDEDDDDEEIDIGVDLSDLELDADDEDDEGADDFNPRTDLPKKVWKATPKEAQELISAHRKHAKRLEKRIEQDSEYADWSKTLFRDAEKSHTPKPQLMGLIEAGMRLNAAAAAGRKDTETAKIFGEVALANGFNFELEIPEPDLSPIMKVLQDKIDDGELPIETAQDILRSVKANAAQYKELAIKAPRKPLEPEIQREWKDPEQVKFDEKVRGEVVQKIATMTKRFRNQFGDAWGKLEERIQREVAISQQATPLPPAQWPKLWAEKAEKVTKAYLKRSKERRGRNRLTGESESLGRGDPANVNDNTSSSSDPRKSFLDQYTK